MQTIITTVLIVGILSLIGVITNKKRNEAEQKIKSLNHASQENAAVQSVQDSPFAGTGFVICYGKGLKAFFYFGLILFFAFFAVVSFLAATGAGGEDGPGIGLVIAFGIFFLFMLFGVGGICVWKVRLTESEVILTTWYGKKKHYTAAQFSKVHKRADTKITAFVADRKAFVIDNNVATSGYFIHWCRERNVPLEIEPQR